MIQLNEYFQGIKETNKLGFSLNNPTFIPKEYLDQKQFIIFRTCHSYGDWVIISSLPKLLKQKYPDSIVVVPSPECIGKYYSPTNWQNKHQNPFNNVIEVFSNNPYVDGMIDEIPYGVPVYHDHFRVYDENNSLIPLAEQILKFWRFTDDEIKDSQPDLYWSKEEINEGDRLIKEFMENKEYGFLYLDDSFFIQDPNPLRESLDLKREIIQKEINKYNLSWFYFYGDKIDNSPYKLNTFNIDVRELKTTLRIQNYIKSKSKLVIGHQGGYGTDCMPRYTQCYVIPIAYNYISEHIVRNSIYLSCYENLENIKI